MAGDVQVGDLIGGRYEVFDVYRGGMGLVYAAADRMSGSRRWPVALKTLRDEFADDPRTVARFESECRLAVGMGSHPNIVRVLALERIEGRPYAVAELVRGGDLRRWIGTPRLDLVTTLRFGVAFCLGMEQAIRQGLRCHRDVKPANLLVGEGRTLKVADFGLAMARDGFAAVSDGPIPVDDDPGPGPPSRSIVWTDGPEAGTAPRPGETVEVGATGFGSTLGFATGDALIGSRLTKAGDLLGTVPYMAPEQFLDARSVDARADIYAFGVVLFEMIAGAPPFGGRTLARLRRQHLVDEPPPLAPAIPRRFAREAARVEAIVRHCLEKEPGRRFGTISALRLALVGCLRRLGR